MSGARPPFAEHPVKRIYVMLDPRGDVERLRSWLRSTLERANWRCHLFLVDGEGPDAPPLASALLPAVRLHLEQHRFSTVALHPLVRVASRFDEGRLRAWQRLDSLRKFQVEAYEEQSESRLMLHPLIAPAAGADVESVLAVVRLAVAELAVPSLLLGREPPAALSSAPEISGLRVIQAPEGCGRSEEVLAKLWAHHVFDSTLERVRHGSDDLLEPCDRHLVVDQPSLAVFPCLRAWRQAAPSVSLDDGDAPPPTAEFALADGLCPECVHESVLAVRGDLELSGRREEARQVCFRVGLALSAGGHHDRAVDVAEAAVSLAGSDADRVAALLHLGLCRLQCGQLAAADEALLESAEHGAEPGIVAFHRGRVQMAWPDEIEALERFDEALASASPEVRRDDLHLQMALAHVKLGEHAEARPHLEHADAPHGRATASFLRGVCDLAEGLAESALGHFSRALELGPDAEDLGRILLYNATCLKELGRFEAAIEHLERAVTLEPGELAHRNLLGFCYYKLGRHREAVDCFLRAIEIDPRSGIDWANLGSNLRDLGRIDEAISAYERALELDPTLGFASDNLARLRRVRS
jgi:tetratricopeptide (TPR) repeat protein